MSDPAENSESTATVRKSRRIMKQNADDLADEKSPTLSKQIKKSKPTEKAEPMDMSEQSETPDPIKSCEPLEKSEVQVTESYEEVDKTEIIDMSEQIKTPDPTNSSETLDKSESIETSTPMDTSGPIEKSEPLEPINIVESAAFTDIEKPEQLKTAIKSPTLDKQIEKSELLKSESIENVELIKNSEEIENREPLVKSDLIDKSEKVETPDLLERVEQTENIELLNQPEPIENIELLNQSEPIENIELSDQPESMKSDPIEKADLIEKSEPVENSAVKVESELLKTDKDIEIKVKPDLTDVSRQIRKQKDKNLCFSCGKTGHKKLDCPLRNQKTENEQTVSESDPSGNKNKENGEDQPIKKRRLGSKQRRRLRAALELAKEKETVKLVAAGEKTESSSSATDTNCAPETTTTDGSGVTSNIVSKVGETNNLKESKPKNVASAVSTHDPLSKKAAVKNPAVTKRNNSSELDTATKKQRLMTKKPESATSSLKSNVTSASAGDIKKQTAAPQTDKTLAKVETENNSSKAGAKITVQIGRERNIQPQISQPQTRLLNYNIPTNQVQQMEVQHNSQVNLVPQSMNQVQYAPYCPLDPRMLFITFDPYKASITQLPPGRKNPPDNYVYNLDFSVTYEFTGRTIYAERQKLTYKTHCKIEFPLEETISKTCFKLIGTKQMIQKMRKTIQKCIEMNHPISSKHLMDVIVPGSPGKRAIEMKISGKVANRLLGRNGRVVDAISKKASVSMIFYPDGLQDESIERFLQIIGPPPGCIYAQKLINGFIQRAINEEPELSFPPNQPPHPPFNSFGQINQQPSIMQPNHPFSQQRFQQPPMVQPNPFPQSFQQPPMMQPNQPFPQQRFQQPPVIQPNQPFPQQFQQPPMMQSNQPFAQQRFQQPPVMQPNQPFAQQRFQPPPMMQPCQPFAQQNFQQPPPSMFNVNQMPPQSQNHPTPQNFTINTPVGHVPKDNKPAFGQHDSRTGFEGHQDSRSNFGRPVNNTPFGQPNTIGQPNTPIGQPINNTPFRQPVNNTPMGHPGNQPGFGQLDNKAAFGHSDHMPKFTDMPRQAPFESSGIIASEQMFNALALKNPDILALARFPEESKIQNVTPEVVGHVSEPKTSEDIASQLLEYCVSLLSDIKNKPKPQKITPAPISSNEVDPILQQLSSLISLSTPQNTQSSMNQLSLEEPQSQQQSLVIDYQHSRALPDSLDHQQSRP